MGAGGEPRPYQQVALTMQTKPVLLHSFAELKALTSSDKDTRYKTEKERKKLWTSVHKENPEPVRIALIDAGNGWAGVKRECVLLKRKG